MLINTRTYLANTEDFKVFIFYILLPSLSIFIKEPQVQTLPDPTGGGIEQFQSQKVKQTAHLASSEGYNGILVPVRTSFSLRQHSSKAQDVST